MHPYWPPSCYLLLKSRVTLYFLLHSYEQAQVYGNAAKKLWTKNFDSLCCFPCEPKVNVQTANKPALLWKTSCLNCSYRLAVVSRIWICPGKTPKGSFTVKHGSSWTVEHAFWAPSSLRCSPARSEKRSLLAFLIVNSLIFGEIWYLFILFQKLGRLLSHRTNGDFMGF